MNKFQKVTEQASHYRHLEKMTVEELLININKEDKTVPLAVEKVLPQIEKLASAISDKMLAGGRLFCFLRASRGRSYATSFPTVLARISSAGRQQE